MRGIFSNHERHDSRSHLKQHERAPSCRCLPPQSSAVSMISRRPLKTGNEHHLLPTGRKRRRSGKLCLSEMLFIMVLFHLSPFKDFKHFWHYGVEQKYRDYFGEIPSYGRFVSLMPRLFIPFCVLMHSLTGDQTGIYVADSTKIAVCHNLRISRNRVFADLAKRGKTTTGWFYGFKLHVVINHKGEIMAIKITPGNTGRPCRSRRYDP